MFAVTRCLKDFEDVFCRVVAVFDTEAEADAYANAEADCDGSDVWFQVEEQL